MDKNGVNCRQKWGIGGQVDKKIDINGQMDKINLEINLNL
jgi:hypothetical protein